MTRQELSLLIDKVIGSKGIMRSSVWWVKRLLNKIVEYLQEYVDSAIKSVKIKSDTEMSDESESTVQNKVIKAYVDDAVSKVGGEVVDTLDSESTTAALSANQGRVLAERIGDIDSILDSINGEVI